MSHPPYEALNSMKNYTHIYSNHVTVLAEFSHRMHSGLLKSSNVDFSITDVFTDISWNPFIQENMIQYLSCKHIKSN